MAAPSRDSTAYKQYEEPILTDERAVGPHKAPPVRKRRRRQKRRTQVSMYLGATVIAAVYLLFCQMQLTQLTAEVSAQTEKLDELIAQSVALTSKKEYSMETDELEEYAVNHLGMIKMDNSQVEYVELINPDEITVTENGFSLKALCKAVARTFLAVVEYIR